MQGSLALSVCLNAIIGWPVSHRGGRQNKDAVCLSAGESQGEGKDDSGSGICVLAAPAVDTGKWGEQMSEAQRTGEEMKEEITEEDNVVHLPVATIRARARHLAHPAAARGSPAVGVSLEFHAGVYLPRCALPGARAVGQGSGWRRNGGKRPG